MLGENVLFRSLCSGLSMASTLQVHYAHKAPACKKKDLVIDFKQFRCDFKALLESPAASHVSKLRVGCLEKLPLSAEQRIATCQLVWQLLMMSHRECDSQVRGKDLVLEPLMHMASSAQQRRLVERKLASVDSEEQKRSMDQVLRLKESYPIEASIGCFISLVQSIPEEAYRCGLLALAQKLAVQKQKRDPEGWMREVVAITYQLKKRQDSLKNTELLVEALKHLHSEHELPWSPKALLPLVIGMDTTQALPLLSVAAPLLYKLPNLKKGRYLLHMLAELPAQDRAIVVHRAVALIEEWGYCAYSLGYALEKSAESAHTYRLLARLKSKGVDLNARTTTEITKYLNDCRKQSANTEIAKLNSLIKKVLPSLPKKTSGQDIVMILKVEAIQRKFDFDPLEYLKEIKAIHEKSSYSYSTFSDVFKEPFESYYGKDLGPKLWEKIVVYASENKINLSKAMQVLEDLFTVLEPNRKAILKRAETEHLCLDSLQVLEKDWYQNALKYLQGRYRSWYCVIS